MRYERVYEDGVGKYRTTSPCSALRGATRRDGNDPAMTMTYLVVTCQYQYGLIRGTWLCLFELRDFMRPSALRARIFRDIMDDPGMCNFEGDCRSNAN